MSARGTRRARAARSILLLAGALAACTQLSDLPNEEVAPNLNGTWNGSLTTGMGDSNISLVLADTTSPQPGGGNDVSGTATITGGCVAMADVSGVRAFGDTYYLDVVPMSGPAWTLQLTGTLQPGDLFEGSWAFADGDPADACVFASSGLFSTELAGASATAAPTLYLHRVRADGAEATATVTWTSGGKR